MATSKTIKSFKHKNFMTSAATRNENKKSKNHICSQELIAYNLGTLKKFREHSGHHFVTCVALLPGILEICSIVYDNTEMKVLDKNSPGTVSL